MSELWSIAEVADHLGVAVPSARGQLSRWGIPAAEYRRGPSGRAEGWYDAEKVRAKHEARPGRGARTDIAQRSASEPPG